MYYQLATLIHTVQYNPERYFVFVGDIIAVLAEEDKLGWCEGRLENGNVGYYPSKYVENI